MTVKKICYERCFAQGEDIGKVIRQYMLTMPMMAPWTKLFRTEIIMKNGLRFDENMRFAEDNVFVLEYLCYCNSVAFLPFDDYKYVPGKDKYKLNHKECVYGLTRIINPLKRVHKHLNIDDEMVIDEKTKMYYLFLIGCEMATKIGLKGYKRFCKSLKMMKCAHEPNPIGQRKAQKILFILINKGFYPLCYLFVHYVYRRAIK